MIKYIQLSPLLQSCPGFCGYIMSPDFFFVYSSLLSFSIIALFITASLSSISTLLRFWLMRRYGLLIADAYEIRSNGLLKGSGSSFDDI